jgi:hypothetical protein
MSCTRTMVRERYSHRAICVFLSHLFKRAVSTRQSNKPPGTVRHLHFALMHGIHDDLNPASPKSTNIFKLTEQTKQGVWLTDSTFDQ